MDMAKSLALLALSAFFFFLLGGSVAAAQWTPAFATFYGGSDASGTMGNCSICSIIHDRFRINEQR
jgi:hypothetical protein